MTNTMQSTLFSTTNYKSEKTKPKIVRQKREIQKYNFSDLEIKPLFQKAKMEFQIKNEYANNHNFEIDDNQNFEMDPKSEIVRIFRESPEDPWYLDNYPYN